MNTYSLDFFILQSNPLLYKLASWNKQDSDKTDCVSTRLQGGWVGKLLTMAEGVVSWTGLTEVFKWQLWQMCACSFSSVLVCQD